MCSTYKHTHTRMLMYNQSQNVQCTLCTSHVDFLLSTVQASLPPSFPLPLSPPPFPRLPLSLSLSNLVISHLCLFFICIDCERDVHGSGEGSLEWLLRWVQLILDPRTSVLHIKKLLVCLPTCTQWLQYEMYWQINTPHIL